MILFLKFLIAHLLGDFVFQSDNWVKDKEKKKIKSPKLYVHIGVHAFLLLILLQFNPKYLAEIFIIVVSHFLIDIAKIYLQKKKTKRIFFFIDQFLHIIILCLATYLYEPFSIDFNQFLSEKNLLFIASIIFLVFVSSILIKIIITQWSTEKEDDQSLAKAGKYIGILERLFVFMFVVLGKWEGVGFLLAAKSIFRFGDLTEAKDRKLTEYILIGTLLSFGLAILTGLVYSHYGR